MLPAIRVRSAESDAFARVWKATYEIFYRGLEAGARLLFRTLFRVRRVGPTASLPAGGLILCPNHQSYLDPAFVQLVVRRRVTFMMTNAFYKVPVANVFFRLVGAIPVAPGRLAWGSVRRAVALLRTGAALVVFPEGRLSTTGEIGAAQRGIGVLARRGRATVVPVAIEGSIRAWPKGAWWLRTADVRLAFGKEIPYTEAAERDGDQAFADRILERVAALKAEIPAARP